MLCDSVAPERQLRLRRFPFGAQHHLGKRTCIGAASLSRAPLQTTYMIHSKSKHNACCCFLRNQLLLDGRMFHSLFLAIALGIWLLLNHRFAGRPDYLMHTPRGPGGKLSWRLLTRAGLVSPSAIQCSFCACTSLPSPAASPLAFEGHETHATTCTARGKPCDRVETVPKREKIVGRFERS